MYKHLFILCFLIPVFFSCEKIQSYPETPQIEFISFTLHDTVLALGTQGKMGLLRFSFVDGDGNIGYDSENDTTDLFLFPFIKVAGKFIEQNLDTSNYPPEAHRIPYMEALGQNKTLQGKIEVKIEYLIIPTDTIKYHFYIIDRDKNKSNVDSTDAIIFD